MNNLDVQATDNQPLAKASQAPLLTVLMREDWDNDNSKATEERSRPKRPLHSKFQAKKFRPNSRRGLKISEGFVNFVV
jgi:hypothetical protein